MDNWVEKKVGNWAGTNHDKYWDGEIKAKTGEDEQKAVVWGTVRLDWSNRVGWSVDSRDNFLSSTLSFHSYRGRPAHRWRSSSQGITRTVHLFMKNFGLSQAEVVWPTRGVLCLESV